MKDTVFGPIASRRLGRSLGVDLLLEKICCQDCIYCEAGRTETLTAERREYVPAEQVISRLKEVLDGKPELDCIPFSGKGEPTLSTAIGKVISFLKENYPQYPVCLLTNGMLLGDPQVREDIARADLVIPSLDASCEEEFIKVNRPVGSISFERFVNGLTDFTRSFSGRIWLELFIVPGANDSTESIAGFAGLIKNMRLDKVQLNTMDRPGTEKVEISSEENSRRFADVLSQYVPVEYAGSFRSRRAPDRTADSRLLELLAGKPMPEKYISGILNLSDFETDLLLKKLRFANRITAVEENGITVWHAVK